VQWASFLEETSRLPYNALILSMGHAKRCYLPLQANHPIHSFSVISKNRVVALITAPLT